MKPWPRHPVIYEINAWVWLQELGGKDAPLSLADVPEAVWDGLAQLQVDAVWLMGVWERSPVGTAIANRNPGLLDDFRRALPDFTPVDNVGSPYCIRSYRVDPHLGGPAGLARARAALAQRGLRLLLDFVPNHVAPDHTWVDSYPEFFLEGVTADLQADPPTHVAVGERILACGRDPYFPAWSDVLQLNAFAAGLRKAVKVTLSDIAYQCDGVRCDMAMLVMNDTFRRTWGERAGATPATDYWPEMIAAVRTAYPDFLFLAEAYWGLEWALQQQGFDYCYDKILYDRLAHDGAESLRLHLCAEPDYQQRLMRFIENHDEPRAAATFSPAQNRAAAVVTLTLSGAKLLHEGQFEGRQVRLPVFLARRPPEPVDKDLAAFYRQLLQVTSHAAFRQGQWQLCPRGGWPGNDSWQNIVGWCLDKDDERFLVFVNLSERAAQAHLQVPFDELRGGTWLLRDILSGERFERSGDEMRDGRLYVGLGPWGYHFLSLKRESLLLRWLNIEW